MFAKKHVGKPDSMARIRICSAAAEEYSQTLKWYAERSLKAAEDFDRAFDSALQTIAETPHRFPLCDSRNRQFLLRRFPIRIIYRLENDDLVVIAVAHTSRAPNYWNER